MKRALVLLAIACTDPPQGTSEPDTGTHPWPDESEVCRAGISGRPVPDLDGTDVSPRTAFSVSFVEDERDGATFRLTRTSTDEPIPFFRRTWSADGEDVWFRSVPLAPDTEHVLTIDYGRDCDPPRHLEVPFRTAALDTDARAADLVDTVWSLDLTGAHVLDPPGLDRLLSSLITSLDPLMLRFSERDGAVRLTIGSGTDEDGTIRQDACAATVDLSEPVYVEDGWFSVDLPAAVPLATAGLTFRALQLRLDGGIAPDGDALLGLHARVMVDMTDFDEVLRDAVAEDLPYDGCELVHSFTSGGIACGPCPDGGDTCLAMVLSDARARRLDAALLDRPADQVAADARCGVAPSGSAGDPLP